MLLRLIIILGALICTVSLCPQNCKCNGTDVCQNCISGKYGPQCNQDCPQSCQTCTSATTCQSCKVGYRGSACQYCIPGKHGTECNQDCPSDCTSGTCIRSSGHCDTCREGYYGNTCDQYCPELCQACMASNDCTICRPHYSGSACEHCIAGKYGPRCDQDCPSGCKGARCKKSSGHCQQCKEGRYGNTCNQDCPSGCKDDTCDKSNGHCQQCKKGWHGNTCILTCSSTCKDGLCKQGSGACFNCVPTYYGHTCTERCPENCIECSSTEICTTCKIGHHGKMCERGCPGSCKNNACIERTGLCTEGCKDKYYGTKCDNKCPTHCSTCTRSDYCDTCEIGFYGYTCEQECGHCKPETPCSKHRGYCDAECIDGYYGYTCSKECKDECKTCESWDHPCTTCTDGKFGKHGSYYACDKDCPEHCVNRSCDRDTGNCLACVGGYTGDKCEKCPEHCQNCSSPGNCTSCKAGYTNTDKQCTCTKDACTTDTCESCISSKWYTDRNVRTCCECSRNCKNRECSSENRCTNGCVTGYYGEDCRNNCSSEDQNCYECKSVGGQYGGCIMCAEGFYPDDVNSTCFVCSGACANSKCSSRNGHCTDGCLPKFWGNMCDKDCPINCLRCDRESGDCLECNAGKYSIDCSKNCSNTCSIYRQLFCSINNGACLHGCNTEVMYGPQCKQPCNDGCIQNKCRWKTGHCLLGCEDSFYGDRCNATCSDGCVSVGSGRRCLANNGSCVAGCNIGLFGERCDAKCSKYCLNDTCSRSEGVCVFGCVLGFSGDACSKYMASSGDQSDTSITWSMVGAVIGAVIGAVVLVGVIIGAILVKRRRSVKEEQAASTPLQTFSRPGPGENMTAEYESVTTYDVLEERREGENEYNTVQPEPGTSRTVTPVYENQNKRDVKPDVHLEPIGSCPDETNAPDYETATTYEALRDRPGTENVYKTVMPDTHQTATTYEALGDRAEPENEYNTVVTDTNPSEGQYGNI